MSRDGIVEFGVEEARKLRLLAHAMRTEMSGRDTMEQGKPYALVIPKVDRYEAREFVEKMIHAKVTPSNPRDAELEWCLNRQESENGLVKRGSKTVVFAKGDDLHPGIQEALTTGHYRRPDVLLILTEKHPQDLFHDGYWTEAMMHLVWNPSKPKEHHTFRWPSIDTRNRADRERLFQKGVQIALDAFLATHQPRTSGEFPRQLESDKKLLDMIAAHKLRATDGVHMVLEWGRKCADIAIAHGDQRLTSSHGIVALALTGEATQAQVQARVAAG